MKQTIRHRGWQMTAIGLLWVLLAHTAAADTIEFRPQAATATLGETLQVDVFASNLNGEIVSAYDLDITYDSLVLAATGVSFGNGLGDSLFFEVFEGFDLSMPGLVDLAQLSLLPDDSLFAIQGGIDVLLATITFQTLSTGVSALDFVFDAFNDVKSFDAAILPVTGMPGQVTVEAPVAVPVAPTPALLLTGLVMLAFRRRRARIDGDPR